MYDFNKAAADGRTTRMYTRMKGGRRPPEKKKPVQLIVLGIIFLFVIALNVLARLSTPFADWYMLNIFGNISDIFSRIPSLVDFSVGEVMIAVAVFGIPLMIVILLVTLIFAAGKRRAVLKFGGSVLAWILAFVALTETMNCFVMYQCTTIEERYYDTSRGYTVDELRNMVEFYITELNTLSAEVERDENGQIYLGTKEELTADCISAMANISDTYPQLEGYYPEAKELRSSMLMTQMNMGGVYFPFSLEANYNGAMVNTKYPSTICHEYTHLKGIILEDEANFISFVATTEYGDKEFAYSGYMMAFNYSYNELARYIPDEDKKEILSKLAPQVWTDNKFVSDEYRQKIEKEAVLSTEKVEEASDTFVDTNLKANGVPDGIVSYTRVVELLLHYYYK